MARSRTGSKRRSTFRHCRAAKPNEHFGFLLGRSAIGASSSCCAFQLRSVHPIDSGRSTWTAGTALRGSNLAPVDRGRNGRFRRVSPVAPRPHEGPLTEPIADAQPRPQERLLMPRSRLSRGQPGSTELVDCPPSPTPAGASSRRFFRLRRTRHCVAMLAPPCPPGIAEDRQ